MPNFRLGMEKIFSGILRYRQTYKDDMVKQFKKVRDNPSPTAVFFTCMDSRMLPTRFTSTNVGDMFIIRNAGNCVPHARLVGPDATATEPAALELGCVINNIEHVVVCGHSDCKAMNLLYSLFKSPAWSHQSLVESPLRAWMCKHGLSSLERFEELEKSSFRRPMLLHAESPVNKFVAYVDPDDKFSMTDKLSMVHTLVQMENITTYGFMQDCVRDGRTHIHAFWFDIYTGEIYYFSRRKKTFLPIIEGNVESFLEEIDPQARASLDHQSAQSIIDTARQNFDKHDDECCDHKNDDRTHKS